MTSRFSLRRLIGSVLAFALCFAFFYLANLLAADVRYPLAIFCLVLSVVCLGVGFCMVSRGSAKVSQTSSRPSSNSLRVEPPYFPFGSTACSLNIELAGCTPSLPI
jgi:hypothetical protein